MTFSVSIGWRLDRKSIFEVQVFISHRLCILFDDDDDDHNDEGEDDHIVGRETIGREIKGAYVFVMLHQAICSLLSNLLSLLAVL